VPGLLLHKHMFQSLVGAMRTCCNARPSSSTTAFQSLVGAMRTGDEDPNTGQVSLFQSLVGAMRTRLTTNARSICVHVSIPRRGNEDLQGQLMKLGQQTFQSLVGAMRTAPMDWSSPDLEH